MTRIALGEYFDYLLDDALDDVVVGLEQIVAAHAGLARESGGDDDDVAVRGVAVIAGRGGDADDAGIGTGDGSRFDHVEGFAGGRAVENVRQDDVG